MTRFFVTTASVLLATSAMAADVETISVEADLTAIQNIEAAQIWTSISDDLETEIAERIIGKIDEDGGSIVVRIDSVELANSFNQAIGIADSKLVGEVEIDAPGLFNKMEYTLTVAAEQATAYFPDGTQVADLTLGSEVYYNAMLDAFADNIASKLDQ